MVINSFMGGIYWYWCQLCVLLFTISKQQSKSWWLEVNMITKKRLLINHHNNNIGIVKYEFTAPLNRWELTNNHLTVSHQPVLYNWHCSDRSMSALIQEAPVRRQSTSSSLAYSPTTTSTYDRWKMWPTPSSYSSRCPCPSWSKWYVS